MVITVHTILYSRRVPAFHTAERLLDLLWYWVFLFIRFYYWGLLFSWKAAVLRKTQGFGALRWAYIKLGWKNFILRWVVSVQQKFYWDWNQKLRRFIFTCFPSFSTQYQTIFLMDRRDKTFPGVSSVHMILYGQWETKYHRTVMVSQAWPWGAKRLPDCNPSPWCTNGLAHQAEPSPSPCAHWKWVMSLQLRSAGGPGLNRTAFCHANTGGDIWNRKTLHEYQTAPCFLAWHTSHFLELIISG